MSQYKNWIISTIFIAFDVVVVYGVFRLTTVVREIVAPLLHRHPLPWDVVSPVAQLGTFIILGMFLLQGLYPGYGLTAIKELEAMGKAITLAFILLATVSYLNKPFQEFPRSIFPIAWALSFIMLPLGRFAARNILSRSKWYGVPVIVFGDGDWAENVLGSLKRVRRMGWRPVALHSVQEFDHQQNYQNAHLAVLASTSSMPMGDVLRSLNRNFRKIVLLREVDNFGSLWVETRDLDGYLGLEFHYHLLSRRNRWVKRMIDVFVSLIGLVFISPFLLLVAFLIAFDSPGPIIYRQERLGRDFKRFHVFKFRTMVLNAEEKLKKLLDENPDVRAQFEEFHKLEKDPRITRVGNFLRKYSIDEIPQLLNVLKGDMSLVGPRAYMSSELEDMGSFAPIILRVYPGLTGWWQIFGRNQTTFKERMQMDEYYISNWSVWMDVYILIKTGFVVFRGTGK